jgi:hypothetical protein
LHETMAKIIANYGKGASIEMYNHATLILQWVASNIWAIRLAQVNESMHPWMVFYQVDDGLRYSINQMKDWHEIMMEHLDTSKKRIRE